MWEAVLILRLIAATVPVTAVWGSRRTSLAMPAGFSKTRFALRTPHSGFRHALRQVEGPHKNNDKTIT